jgi:hypothetical protein
MSDLLKLSDAERNAFRNVLSTWYARKRAGAEGYNYERCIDMIQAAVNNVRLGDPVGTLRRNPNGTVYERCELDGERYWEALSPWPTLGLPRKIHPDPEGIADWRVIYAPEHDK